jgi:hypothetical protein
VTKPGEFLAEATFIIGNSGHFANHEPAGGHRSARRPPVSKAANFRSGGHQSGRRPTAGFKSPWRPPFSLAATNQSGKHKSIRRLLYIKAAKRQSSGVQSVKELIISLSVNCQSDERFKIRKGTSSKISGQQAINRPPVASQTSSSKSGLSN